MEIKVLGTGCKKCKTLEKMTIDVVEELGLEAKVEKVEDIQKIMDYGVMSTPALVIDGAIAFSGKLPKEKELKEIINLNK